MKSLIFAIITILVLFTSCNEEKKIVEINDIEETETLDIVVDDDAFYIYLSADMTGAKESGLSIERGILTALSEVDNKINGRKVLLRILDHRGNNERAKQHLNEFLSDDKALVLFSGLHSPPLLEQRDFINEEKILVLDPWAAAGPITRYPSEENWIFRLSIDDTKAGYVITEYAIDIEEFKSPYLVLEDTGWGNSNLNTMSKALTERDIEPAGVVRFNWSLGINKAKTILREAKKLNADVIFFVGNAPEGKNFALAMSELDEDQRLPIRSHWGITGGDFAKVITKEIRDKIDLAFLQTSFSFITEDANSFSDEVYEKAKALFHEIKTEEDIEAPTGFIHSYDLTRLLITAIEEVKLTDDIVENRNLIRLSLENLEDPIQGLIKEYNKPFSVFNESNPDAHEALNIEDYVMAKYGDNNEIILLEK